MDKHRSCGQAMSSQSLFQTLNFHAKQSVLFFEIEFCK